MISGLHTDRYELTMLDAAISAGIHDRPAAFEAFTRRIPAGSWGVMVGTAAIADAVAQFRFGADDVSYLESLGALAPSTIAYLRDYRFGGVIRARREGELFAPKTPLVSVEGALGECLVLETIVLSILNAGIPVASAAAQCRRAAGNEALLLEMGSRRIDPHAAVVAARNAYVGGVDATSNLEAGRRFGVPTAGTAAHAWVLANDTECDAFVHQLRAAGPNTTLLVDTYDIASGVRTAVEAANRLGFVGPAAIRIDSGDPEVEARRARALLDALGATATRIVFSGEVDVDTIRALRADGVPVDGFGLGTRLVLAPSVGCVYKLVERDGRPVAKRSEAKPDVGGAKRSYRYGNEHVVVIGAAEPPPGGEPLDEIVFAGGRALIDTEPIATTAAARARCRAELDRLGDRATITVQWKGVLQ